MGLLNEASVQMDSFGECCVCGTPIWGASNRKKNCLEKKGSATFYCINGHAQHYLGETEAEKLRKQLERATKEKEWAEQATKTARQAEAIAKGKLKAQTERVKNGVCPCCNRSFQNLRRHMATKHPEHGADHVQKT